MKNATWLVLLFFLSFPPAMAQKLDSILSKSSLSVNYGPSHDFLGKMSMDLDFPRMSITETLLLLNKLLSLW